VPVPQKLGYFGVHLPRSCIAHNAYKSSLHQSCAPRFAPPHLSLL